MLTYDMNVTGRPLYQHLYECVRDDILQGRLRINEKMPSVPLPLRTPMSS